jgi:hypothetical protein
LANPPSHPSINQPIEDRLSAFRIGDIRGESDLLVRLGEEIFCPLRVAAKLVIVGSLGCVEFLVCLHDIPLGGRHIAMPVRINVYDWGLGKRYSNADETCVDGGGDKKLSLRHECSPGNDWH